MNKSLSRESRTTTASSGYLKIVAVFSLIAIAVGFVVTVVFGQPDKQPYFGFAAPFSEPACVAGEPADASCASDSGFSSVPESSRSNPAAGTAQRVAPVARAAIPIEPTATAPAAKELPMSARYTIAELCALDPKLSAYVCQAAKDAARTYFANAVDFTEPQTDRTLSGSVLTEQGRPVAAIRLVATLQAEQRSDNSALRFWTETDANGRYTLRELPEGRFVILASGTDDYPAARIQARTGVANADITLRSEQVTNVYGQVLASDGTPLDGVTVLPVLAGQASVLTDYEGRFSIPLNLKSASDAFSLRLQRPGFHEKHHKVSLVGRSNPSEGVDLGNILINPVEAWTSLDGVVLSESGQPVANHFIELRPAGSRQKFAVTTNSEGGFHFAALPANAAYRLIVFGGSSFKDKRRDFQLDSDTGRLEIFLERYEFGSVSGQLVNLNGEPVPQFELVLKNTASAKPNARVTSDAYGRFAVDAAPAGNIVLANQTAATSIHGLQLKPDDSINVPLIVDWGMHEIRGTVLDANNNPVPASQVLLRWVHETNGIKTQATRRASADSYGQFAFNELGPGPHSLQVSAPGHRPVYMDHDASREGYDLIVRLN